MKSPNAKPRGPIKAAIPLVQQLLKVADNSGLLMREIGEKSGVHWRSISNWRTGAFGVNLFNFQAVAESLGYELILRKRPSLNDNHHSNNDPPKP